jgi:hypothetical protein
LTGTPRTGTGRPETGLSALPPVPEEITARRVKNFLKGLRKSRKETPARAVSTAPAEGRVGMADAAPR